MLLKIKQLGRQGLNSNPFRPAYGACHQPKWKELRRQIFLHNSNPWKAFFNLFFLFFSETMSGGLRKIES